MNSFNIVDMERLTGVTNKGKLEDHRNTVIKYGSKWSQPCMKTNKQMSPEVQNKWHREGLLPFKN